MKLAKSAVSIARTLLATHLDIGLNDWTTQDEAELRAAWELRDSPRYDLVARRVAALAPGSVLEVGAGCGNMLVRLRRELPVARLVGIDLSPVAVASGTRWLAEEGIRGVELSLGAFEDLSRFPTGSYDLVLSSAALMYVHSRDIQGVLENLIRVAAHTLVLMEPHGDRLRFWRGQLDCPPNWKRDYRRLFEAAGVAADRVKIEPLSTGVWDPGGGGAAFIEVESPAR